MFISQFLKTPTSPRFQPSVRLQLAPIVSGSPNSQTMQPGEWVPRHTVGNKTWKGVVIFVAVLAVNISDHLTLSFWSTLTRRCRRNWTASVFLPATAKWRAVLSCCGKIHQHSRISWVSLKNLSISLLLWIKIQLSKALYQTHQIPRIDIKTLSEKLHSRHIILLCCLHKLLFRLKYWNK